MTGIQLVAIAFAAAMLFNTHRAFRRRELRPAEYAIWILIWVSLILISLFPAPLRALVPPLQVARLLDLVMVGGLFLLAMLVFSLTRQVRRLENRLVALVSALAIGDGDSQPGRSGGVGVREPRPPVEGSASRP